MRVTEEDCLEDKVLSALRQVVKFYSDKVLNVAFSGGLDSSVLLTGLAMLRDQHRCHLRALHVNHGWTEDAKVWESACARYAHTLGIEFRVTRLSRPSAKKLSTEAAARRQRLEWFAQVAGPGEPVLTAHHSDDQAETFLLRLMRGAGTRGLGGMQFEREFKGMLVLRPLLGLSRADLQTWAQTQGLSPIEDPANTDTRFDRNFARHEILPLLESRWPGAGQTLNRAAKALWSTQKVLDEVGASDLRASDYPIDQCLLGVNGAIAVSKLNALSLERRLNLLRYWFAILKLEPPSEKALQEFLRQLWESQTTGAPALRVGSASLRRYRGGLFLIPAGSCDAHTHSPVLQWHGVSLEIEGVDIAIEATQTVGRGLKSTCLDHDGLELRWHRGGARVCPVGGSGHRRPVRKLFQEAGVPPWERKRLPLLYHEGRLVCIPGVAIAQSQAVSPGEPGLEIHVSDLRPRAN